MTETRIEDSVLLTHPGRQHSHQAAIGLEHAGLLAGYWAGVPPIHRTLLALPPGFWRRFVRYAAVAIPEEKCRAYPGTPALRRLGDRLLPRAAAGWLDFYACRRFDRQVARRVGRFSRATPAARALLANEISALASFRGARPLGWRVFLDAPSFHPTAQDRLHGTTDGPRLHRAIRRVKDAEIEAADHILCVSELARRTYLDAGVAAHRVHALVLGADLELFRPAVSGSEPDRAFRFVFVGAPIRRKGFDLLAAAFGDVLRSRVECELRLVGPRPTPPLDLPGTSATGSVSQTRLAEELRRADCLVLPSRNDSFGMVVPEALASGIPVLVSDMVGAKDLVEPGRTGWIVPHGDVAALATCMISCVRRRDALRAMSADCRRAAQGATWESYHRRLGSLMRDLLAA